MPESARAAVKRRLDGLKGQILLARIHSHADMSENDAMRLALEAQKMHAVLCRTRSPTTYR